MRKFYTLAFLIFCFTAIAQSQILQGKLADLIDNKPLPGATLKLTPLKDSNSHFNIISDTKGFFRFANLPKDSFML
jgi:hypothetical protein